MKISYCNAAITLASLCILTANIAAQEQSPRNSSEPSQSQIAAAPATVTPANAKPADIIFSEICYQPKQGEPEWLEITNISEKSINIKDWTVTDGQSLNFVISSQPLHVPAQGVLVILLDGTGQPTTPFDNNHKAVTHTGTGVTGNLLGDSGGHIALYSPPPAHYDSPSIHSYVAWGFSPGRIIADAIKANVWSTPSFLPDKIVPGTDPETLVVPRKIMQPGGSIGLIEPTKTGPFQPHWGIFAHSEVNPGKVSFERGITLAFPPDGWKSDRATGIYTLRVVQMGKDTKYQFQVSADRAFQQVYLDSIQQGPNYIFEKPIPRNSIYYWRARLVNPDGTVALWSEVRSITYGYPK